jgi:hypothetical protein
MSDRGRRDLPPGFGFGPGFDFGRGSRGRRGGFGFGGRGFGGSDDIAPIVVVLVLAVLGWKAWGADIQQTAVEAGDRAAAAVSRYVDAATSGGLLQPDTVDPGAAAAPYSRDAFGQAWADVDRNGCDTRNDILARDLLVPVFRDGSDCVVVAGTLQDPFTGTVIPFTKEQADQVHVDHLVPLSWAWQHGASAWPEGTRVAFANDPENLWAVQGAANMAKGDAGPSAWMPVEGSRCGYAQAWRTVTAKYGLPLPPADAAALPVC